MKTFSRRDFVWTAGAAVVGSAALGSGSLARGAGGKWLVTSRDAHLKATGEADVWAAMKLLGVDGLEVDVNEKLECASLYDPAQKWSLATADDIKKVKEQFQKSGKVITSFCMHNHLDERLEQEVEWTGKLVKAAQELGVGVIRLDVVPRKMTVEEFLPFAIKACKQLCATAEGTPVRFGVENHSKITNDPNFTEKLFDGVGSAKLGLTLDCMNFYWYGHPLAKVYTIIEKFAPRVFHTHCKNLKYPDDKKNEQRPMGWEYAKYMSPLYDGDIDYKRIADILRKANYQGDLCVENECLRRLPKEQHPEILKKEIAYLRSVV